MQASVAHVDKDGDDYY